MPGQILAGQHIPFGLECGDPALPQHAREKAVKALVVARGHRVAPGSHIAMMYQQMLGPEMGIKHRRKEQVGQPAFEPVSLMHQLVAVIDPDRAADDADAEEEQDLFQRVQVVGMGDIPDRAENHAELQREPDQRDRAIPEKLFLGGLKVRVFQIEPGEGVKNGEQPPGGERHQQQPEPALGRDEDEKRDQAERQPEGQGVVQFGDGCSGDHRATRYDGTRGTV